nr:hypothetical protein SHINE37_80140 [Rhizobiaceae bacterium]
MSISMSAIVRFSKPNDQLQRFLIIQRPCSTLTIIPQGYIHPQPEMLPKIAGEEPA